MGDYSEGADLIARGVISLHNAGHSNIPVMLKLLAREYTRSGILSFLPPVDETYSAVIIPFPKSPDEVTP